MKDKPTSIRLPNKTIEDIDNICDGIGCSRNEWIKDTLRDGVRRENSQDQGIKDTKPEPEPEPEPEPTPEPKPEVKVVEIPNVTVSELKNIQIVEEPLDNSKKPVIEMVEFNGTYIPKGEVYET